MLELLLCSAVTVFPDFLYRRFVQGKRIGHEITLFSVWYELRWGITLCLILTISLITVIFYFHPSTSNAVSFFRTISILPETNGRVSEVYVKYRDRVTAGQPLFKLDSTEEEAAIETASRKITEVKSSMQVAKAQLASRKARSRRHAAPCSRLLTSSIRGQTCADATQTPFRNEKSTAPG